MISALAERNHVERHHAAQHLPALQSVPQDGGIADAVLKADDNGIGGRVTRDGVRNNVSVALQYLESWLRGSGAVGIFNLMEDTATAEIARAQLWQWIRHQVPLDGGGTVTASLYREVRDAELAALVREREGVSRYDEAAGLLDALVLSETFTDFLTIPGYQLLDGADPDRGATP